MPGRYAPGGGPVIDPGGGGSRTGGRGSRTGGRTGSGSGTGGGTGSGGGSGSASTTPITVKVILQDSDRNTLPKDIPVLIRVGSQMNNLKTDSSGAVSKQLLAYQRGKTLKIILEGSNVVKEATVPTTGSSKTYRVTIRDAEAFLDRVFPEEEEKDTTPKVRRALVIAPNKEIADAIYSRFPDSLKPYTTATSGMYGIKVLKTYKDQAIKLRDDMAVELGGQATGTWDYPNYLAPKDPASDIKDLKFAYDSASKNDVLALAKKVNDKYGLKADPRKITITGKPYYAVSVPAGDYDEAFDYAKYLKTQEVDPLVKIRFDADDKDIAEAVRAKYSREPLKYEKDEDNQIKKWVVLVQGIPKKDALAYGQELFNEKYPLKDFTFPAKDKKIAQLVSKKFDRTLRASNGGFVFSIRKPVYEVVDYRDALLKQVRAQREAEQAKLDEGWTLLQVYKDVPTEMPEGCYALRHEIDEWGVWCPPATGADALPPPQTELPPQVTPGIPSEDELPVTTPQIVPYQTTTVAPYKPVDEGLPDWVLPVGIGATLLVGGTIVYLITRRDKK